MQRYDLFIDGESRPPASGQWFDSDDPYMGEPWAQMIVTPWNSPLMLLAWKLAPALAAGCTVVIKPSEFTSASTVELAKLFTESGLPPGVVNVVTGFGDDVGAPLVEHPVVRKITFTGSDSTGRHIN